VKRLSTTLLLLCAVLVSPAKAADILVFAAASTTTALDEISTAYAQKTGVKVTTSFAGSSKLAKQIYAGAPADLFLSANIQWMDYLEENNAIEPQTRSDLLGNNLVLVQPKDDSKLITLKSLTASLKDNRLALGDPAHVPAGIYAKQALKNLKLWSSVEQRIAAMPNVRTALAMVDRGEVAAGIVYATDAEASSNVRISLRFPQGSHQLIRYPVAVVKGRASEQALAFLQYLKSPEAVKLFTKHGFSVSN